MRLGKLILLIMELTTAVKVLKTYVDNAAQEDHVLDTYFMQDLVKKVNEIQTIINNEIA